MLRRFPFAVRLTLLLLPILLLPATLQAAPPKKSEEPAQVEGKTVRLLTIGNSFSRNATHFLDDLAKGGGHTLVHHPIVVGGASLELHADRATLHADAPENPAGLYSDGQSLIQKLQLDRWDAVTIQQASRISHDPDTYRPYAARLSDLIRQQAPQAKLLVHQTWAYRIDDPRFTGSRRKPGEPATHVEMHRQLRAAYFGLAQELDADIIPVGDAFQAVAENPTWAYRPDTAFDFATAKFPELPDQRYSLHVGWRWRKGKNDQYRLGIDGHHANIAGEYLGSCVFYETLFEADVTTNPFVPSGLDPAFARFLRQTAHEVVSATHAATAQ